MMKTERKLTANDAVKNVLVEINSKLKDEKFVFEKPPTNDKKKDYYFRKAMKAWIDENELTPHSMTNLEFIQESGVKEMDLSPFEIYHLSGRGVVPIELFFYKNERVLEPHEWLDLFYTQILVRKSREVFNIVDDIVKLVNIDNVFSLFQTMLEKEYSTECIDTKFYDAKYKNFSILASDKYSRLTQRLLAFDHSDEVEEDNTVQLLKTLLWGYNVSPKYVGSENYENIEKLSERLKTIYGFSLAQLREKLKVSRGDKSSFISALLRSQLNFDLKLVGTEHSSNHFVNLIGEDTVDMSKVKWLLDFKAKKELGL